MKTRTYNYTSADGPHLDALEDLAGNWWVTRRTLAEAFELATVAARTSSPRTVHYVTPADAWTVEHIGEAWSVTPYETARWILATPDPREPRAIFPVDPETIAADRALDAAIARGRTGTTRIYA